MKTPARPLVLLAAGLCCASLAACDGASTADPGASTATTTAAASPNSPAGTATSTAEVSSGAPSSTTPIPSPTVSSSDPAKDPLYLEAVEVYKKYYAEMQKFEAAGYPTAKLPASMDQYITGDMKAAVQATVARARAIHRMPEKGSHGEMSAIGPNAGASIDGSLASIRVCIDGRQAHIVDPTSGRRVGMGSLAFKEVYFKRFQGELKAFAQTAKVVSSCPI